MKQLMYWFIKGFFFYCVSKDNYIVNKIQCLTLNEFGILSILYMREFFDNQKKRKYLEQNLFLK